MSASAVLNLIAPSAPLPVQAANDADASAFGGLLSGALSGEATADDTPTPTPTTPPSKDAKSTVRTPFDDKTPGTLVDPAGLNLIQFLPPAPVDLTDVIEDPDVALTFPGPTVDRETEASATDAARGINDQRQVMPLPIVQTLSVSTAPATVTSTTSAASSILPDVTATDAADAALLAAAAKAVTDDTRTTPPPPPAQPNQTAAVPVPQVQPPAPAPLKPASERTGRTHDGLTREGGDGSVSADASKSSATASGPTASPPPVPGKSPTDTGALPSASATLTGDADLSGDLNAYGATASLDTAKAHAEAAITHDASLSTLSRASIDATAQIAAQIIRKLDARSTRFEMALTPDDLGRVDVKLEIDAEGRLAARMAFDNPAAAADLRGRADELRRQLQDAGFHVPDDAFEFAERDSGSSAFDRGTSDQNDNQRQNRAFSAASRLNAETDVAQPPRWMTLSLRPSGVDLKV